MPTCRFTPQVPKTVRAGLSQKQKLEATQVFCIDDRDLAPLDCHSLLARRQNQLWSLDSNSLMENMQPNWCLCDQGKYWWPQTNILRFYTLDGNAEFVSLCVVYFKDAFHFVANGMTESDFSMDDILKFKSTTCMNVQAEFRPSRSRVRLQPTWEYRYLVDRFISFGLAA